MKKFVTVLLLMLIPSVFLQSQVFSLFDIDASDFPIMRAKFYLFDKDGNQVTNLSESDFEVIENGMPRNVFLVSCPTVKPAIALSSVLVMDASGSMGGLNLHLAKVGAASFITGIRNIRSETAINSFDEKSHIVAGFTTNKEGLLAAVEKISYNKYGWTNYNAGLIDPNAGALYILKAKGNKKLIIFLSDGKPTTDTRTLEIATEASQQGAKIYSVAIRMSIQKEMRELAELTGGKWFDNIYDEERAGSIYKEILELEQGEDSPCTIEWISESVCSPTQINVAVNSIRFSKISTLTYQSPPKSIAKLIIDPFSINFGGIRPNFKKDTIIKFTAQNDNFEITDIISSNNAFVITPRSFNLKAGESRNVTVSFTPKDSSYTYGEFDVVTAKCPEKIFVSGGWPGKPPPKPTLALTHPNGGELFVVGSDTIITWKGITPSDTVSIEYSINGGTDWNLITNIAEGLKYNWKNIPKPPSDKCLVKITQQSATGFEETAIAGGSTQSDNGVRIVKDNLGNLIVVGNFSANAVISGRNFASRGGSDFFMIKYDNSGNVVWVRGAGSTSNDFVRDVATDNAGNVFIVGDFYRSVGFGGSNTVTSRGGSDVFVAKYNANGNIQWVASAGGEGNDFGTGIAVSPTGQVVISGNFVESIRFGSETLTGTEDFDAFIVSYNTNGTLLWLNKGTGFGNILPRDVAYDNVGSVFVIGDYTQTANFGNQIISSAGNEDVFVLKYDLFGNLQLAKSFGGAGQDYGMSVNCDIWGSPVIAGGFMGISSFGSQTLTSRDLDAFVAKLDEMANVLWAKNGGGQTADVAMGVAVDQDGSVAITGYFNGKANFGNFEIISKGAKDVFTARYSGSGSLLWVRSAGGADNITGYGITFDRDGHLAATGGFESEVQFGLGKYTSRGNIDFFLWRIKYVAIQSDVSDSLFTIAMPQPISQNIDMRQVMVGFVKDSVITSFIRNIGSYKFEVDSIYFRGADAAAFDIVSGYPKYIVEPKGEMYAELRFRPLKIGSHNAEIVIMTQSDTLVQTIRGIGVQPQIQVVNPIIDFGIVQVGDTKDTLKAVTVKNIGNATLYILSTKHSYPNDVDFSTLAGGGAFQLKPGDTAKMDLRFVATNAGRTSGTLEFHYDGVGSPAVIQLYGEGVDLSPRILSEYIPMNDITCESSSDGSVRLSNAGINPLIINDITISGTDASNFSVAFNPPLSIQKDSTVELPVTFVPKSSGTKNAVLIINSNSVINPELEIPISARKDSISIISLSRNIDLGYVCPNEIKDTIITIKNIGTLESSAELIPSNIFELSDNLINLLPDEDISVNFRLLAQTAEGIINGTIKIVDDLCKYEYIINISANISLPIPDADDIVINTFIGQPKDGIINIRNTGQRDFVINSAPQINSPFEFVGNVFPLEIKSGQSADVVVRYTPVSIGEESIILNFETEQCSQVLPVKVSTITGSAGATLDLPNISAYAGEIISIPLQLKNVVNLSESGVTGFDLTVSFNRTLLAPLDYPAIQIDENTAEVRIKDLKPNANSQLGALRFRAGLGNAEETELNIIEIKSLGANSNINTIDGKFTLLGICEEGGTRLFNPHGTAGIKQISPNPTDKDIIVQVNLIEKATTKLTVFNSLGILCDEFIFEGSIGLHEVELSISDYSSGLYYIHLQTPTVNEVKKFVVVK